MRHVFTLAALALLGGYGVVHAQERGGGQQANRSFPLTGFDKVTLRGSDNVIVRVGSAESVNVTGPAELLDQLEVEVRGGELRLGRKRTGWNWGDGDRGHATFTITLPRLTAAAVAGSGDMTVDHADAPRFAASVAGSGDLRIDRLRADDAAMSVAGSGDARIGTGRTGAVDISVAGSGDVDAAGLEAERAKISVAGSGNVRAGVTREANVSIIGSGDVDVVGGARCQVSKMGSGEVRCPG